ncbi:hypothetical protein ACH4SP_42370 [Streptomyces sp. NPDC021093]|uniref:hypothetical protein n=1 Tax=Streptomyces sp. NPDC021093 TaxID=3365112 RepID=UPI003795BC88
MALLLAELDPPLLPLFDGRLRRWNDLGSADVGLEGEGGQELVDLVVGGWGVVHDDLGRPPVALPDMILTLTTYRATCKYPMAPAMASRP